MWTSSRRKSAYEALCVELEMNRKTRTNSSGPCRNSSLINVGKCRLHRSVDLRRTHAKRFSCYRVADDENRFKHCTPPTYCISGNLGSFP